MRHKDALTPQYNARKLKRTMGRDCTRHYAPPRLPANSNEIILPYYFHLQYRTPSPPANSISPPKLVRGTANFLSVPAQNKLCSEWGRRRAADKRDKQEINKTDERESRRLERDGCS